MSYGLSLHGTARASVGVITTFVGALGFGRTTPFTQQVLSAVGSYFSQKVDPIWQLSVEAGIVLVAAGAILVAIGDRKRPSEKEQAPLEQTAIPVKNQQ